MTEVQLLQNPLLGEWTAGVPNNWTQISGVNTTLVRLQKTDPKTHPERLVFSTDLRVSDRDYIHAGENGFRARIAAPGGVRSWLMGQNTATTKGLITEPNQDLVLRITARCNVENNLLGVALSGMDGTVAEAYGAAPVVTHTSTGLLPIYVGGQLAWSTTTGFFNLSLRTRWKTFGIPLSLPSNPDFLSLFIQIGNNTAGAQVIDIGEVALSERQFRVGGNAA